MLAAPADDEAISASVAPYSWPEVARRYAAVLAAHSARCRRAPPPSRAAPRPQRQRLGRAAVGVARRRATTSRCSSPARTCTRSASSACASVEVAHAARRAPGRPRRGRRRVRAGRPLPRPRAKLAGRDDRPRGGDRHWFSAQAARLKPRLGFRLVVTVWETLPWRDAYRWPRERALPARGAAGGRPVPRGDASGRARGCCSRACRPTGSGSPSRASTSSASPRRASRAGASTWSCRPGGWCGRRATRTCCARSPRCAAGWWASRAATCAG